MGLDMYLSKKIYLGANYEHNNVKGTIELTQGKDNTPVKIDLSKVTYIIERVMYWRKANQIHKWFVDNVQDGEDNCKEYYVSNEQLTALMEACKEVLADHSKAEELLPVASGFFFGGTEYGEYYFECLQDTVDALEPVLSNKDNESHEFEYSSSW